MSLREESKLFGRRLTQREVQWVLPRVDEGIDWGTERVVLVECGTKQLWWQRSGTVYVGGNTGNKYVESELCLVDYDGAVGAFGPRRRVLVKGGRLSTDVLRAHADAIEHWFDFPGLAYKLNPHVTAVIA